MLVTCPHCNGQARTLGSLGNLTHYRCQDCGAEFNRQRKIKPRSQEKARTLALRRARQDKQARQEGE